MEARSNHADINKIAKRYDWTFTPSNYKGCLLSEENSDSLKVSVTDEKIDYERLKIQEKIVYFDEIILYEDELDDNGIAKLSIKIVSSQKFYIYYIVLLCCTGKKGLRSTNPRTPKSGSA